MAKLFTLRVGASALILILVGCTGTPSSPGREASSPPAGAATTGVATPGALTTTATPPASPVTAKAATSPAPARADAPRTTPSPAASPAASPVASPVASPAASPVASPVAPSAIGAASPQPGPPPAAALIPADRLTVQEYPVPPGSGPHDVWPTADGLVWYTAQRSGELGRLDPATGETRHIELGQGSRPHGVIAGPDGALWITDGGLNAIVRVDPATEEVRRFPLPADRPAANLNTATFDRQGIHWFTGQAGIYGRLDPATGRMEVFDAPRGAGPYGIDSTPDGQVYYASLAGSHIARIDTETGAATVIEPPTPRQGARRVWSDSRGRIWVSEWNAGQVAVYDPADGSWREWRLPGDRPQAYAVYVDESDAVWLSDFGANALVRFDPTTETFDQFPLPSRAAAVRQIAGRPGEVWGAESGVDKLVVIREP